MADVVNGTQPGDPSAAAAASVAAWEQANPGLVAGLTPVREVAVAGDVAATPTDQELWGAALPAELKTSLDPPALARLVARADYLAVGRETPGRWAERLAGCRAALLPGRVVVAEADVAPIRQFVASGGLLIAFAHASLLNASEAPRKDYLVANVLGAHYDGLVSFDSGVQVTVTGDSIWAPQYAPPNVIDGTPDTFWASVEAGPMPHWVEIAFSQPRTVARADVACRPGFLLRDFEVQYRAGEEWRTAAAKVTDNQEWTIRCDFDKAVETGAVRLFVKREEINGVDRVIADVGEFTPYDDRGRPIIVPPFLIAARITDPAWAKANHADRMVLRSPAVRIRPASAQVLASFPSPTAGEGELPFCTQSKLGKGRAYLFAVPEGSLGEESYAWESLLRTFVGLPAIRHSGDESVLAFLSRGRDRYLLHIVDAAPTDSAERAKEVIVRVNTRALGGIGSATLAPGDTALEISQHAEWVQFRAPLDPMASILLRRAR